MDPTLLGAAGLLFAGAITPGPNNFVVLREAARAGWSAAIPAIVGTVLGGVGLLLVVYLGIGVTLDYQPRLIAALGLGGCSYLVVLGFRIAMPGQRPSREAQVGSLPAGFWGLALFQVANPKAWLVVLAITTSLRTQLGPLALMPLLGLFVIIPTVCLSLWSWFGVALERKWQTDRRRRLDRLMGTLLIVSALLLLYTTLEVYR